MHEPEPEEPVAPRGPRLLLYAERPRRRARQMIADVLVVAWVVVVALVATAVHDVVLRLQAPGRNLADAGGRVSGAFTDAAGAADNVPLIGDRLAGALGGGTRGGQSLTDAGNTLLDAAATAATGLAWLVVLIAAVPVAAVWIVLRLRWVIAARTLVVARDGPHADADLLALRALVSAPTRRLARTVPGAADGWRQGNARVVAELADVALAEHGLRGPTLVRRASWPTS